MQQVVKQASTLKKLSNGLINLKGNQLEKGFSMVRDMTKEDLIDKGTQLSTVARYEKAKTRIFLLAVLKDTIDYVEANKTLNQNTCTANDFDIVYYASLKAQSSPRHAPRARRTL